MLRSTYSYLHLALIAALGVAALAVGVSAEPLDAAIAGLDGLAAQGQVLPF
jgi:hypothetical protein